MSTPSESLRALQGMCKDLFGPFTHGFPRKMCAERTETIDLGWYVSHHDFFFYIQVRLSMKMLSAILFLSCPVVRGFFLSIKNPIISARERYRFLATPNGDDINKVWSITDQDWIIDANSIDYVGDAATALNGTLIEYPTFDFLREEIGLNISKEISSRTIVPHHLTTASDIFCNREVNMQQIKAVGFDMVLLCSVIFS